MIQTPQRNGQAGVTLLELAIVLAIVAILAMAAVPSIIDRWQRETVILLANRFASTVSLARATAQYEHMQTNIMPNRRNWNNGWWLTTQSANDPDKTSEASDGTIVFSVSVPKVPAVRIDFPIRGNALSYAPVGYSRDSKGGQLYGTLTISSGRHTRQVRISSVGRARICNPDTDSKCSLSSDDDSDP